MKTSRSQTRAAASSLVAPGRSLPLMAEIKSTRRASAKPNLACSNVTVSSLLLRVNQPSHLENFIQPIRLIRPE